MEIQFIKIFDAKAASTLRDSGFSYVEERINDNQTVYCFEESEEFVKALRSICGKNDYQEAIAAVRGGSLYF